MRQDQFERLQQLEERLIDVAIEEADPDQWPGKGVAVAAMDQQTRGDRYWVKKNAVATISLAQRVGVLMSSVQGFGTTPTAEEGDDQQQRHQQQQPAPEEFRQIHFNRVSDPTSARDRRGAAPSRRRRWPSPRRSWDRPS